LKSILLNNVKNSEGQQNGLRSSICSKPSTCAMHFFNFKWFRRKSEQHAHEKRKSEAERSLHAEWLPTGRMS